MTKIAIIDADLISRRNHRFPNLVCMKLSAYHKSLGDIVELKSDFANLSSFAHVYIAKVFSDTEIPAAVLTMKNVSYGGTGFFFDKAEPLPSYIEHHYPDYDLYKDWVNNMIAKGYGKGQFKFYTDYSIGYLTRGCFRKCPFCVNQKYDRVVSHSPLEEFYDPDRPKICFLDDNFFCCPQWEEILNTVKDTGKKYRFMQGMDERIMDDKRINALVNSNYDGVYTFAFDNIADSDLIEQKLALLRKYTSAEMRFYVLCAYDRQGVYDESFWVKDIFDTLSRIAFLMQNNCLPYVMRFIKYKESPYKRFYSTLARWTNQPGIFRNKSLNEFAHIKGQAPSVEKIIKAFEEKFPLASRFYDLKYVR